MTRIIGLLAMLAFALAYPRIALMAAAVAAVGSYVIVRWLLGHRTVFKLSTWSPRPAWSPRPVWAGWA